MTATDVGAAFARSRDRFESVASWLNGDDAAVFEHGDLEARLEVDGRDLLRLLFQDHLDLRAQREARVEVTDADGIGRNNVETGHRRGLVTVFGELDVTRYAYRKRRYANMYPADAVLNLPPERHSHGLRRLAAIEASRGSFDGAVEAIRRATGQQIGKRQTEQMAASAAVDFEAFYAARQAPAAGHDKVLVLSCDGKGIVMRPAGLRPTTANAAVRSTNKLSTRLSKGEKRNRKRMAEVGTVYDVTPVARVAADIISDPNNPQEPAPGPVTTNKWLIASVVDDAASVVAAIFDEAERRDPDHHRTWVALVDGNNHQIDRIHAEANSRKVTVHVIVDFIHAMEYLWSAAWCFFNEGDPAAQDWVRQKAVAVLCGNAAIVAAAIRRKATTRHLDPARRANADTCANYLTRKRRYLDYRTALAKGWPIATGVIEGACRHLVKDRMDLTGARWGLHGAETILKLRAINSNGDFTEYWQYHTTQEQHRNHHTRYTNHTIPTAA